MAEKKEREKMEHRADTPMPASKSVEHGGAGTPVWAKNRDPLRNFTL
jgi:hypothetical protein